MSYHANVASKYCGFEPQLESFHALFARPGLGPLGNQVIVSTSGFSVPQRRRGLDDSQKSQSRVMFF